MSESTFYEMKCSLGHTFILKMDSADLTESDVARHALYQDKTYVLCPKCWQELEIKTFTTIVTGATVIIDKRK